MGKRLSKQLFILLLYIAFTPNAFAQKVKGSIHGIVWTSDSVPAVGVNVRLEKPTVATKTDGSGSFRIEGLTEGNYKVVVSLGMDSVSANAVVTGQRTTEMQFRLDFSHEQLQEVIVTSGTNRYSKKESDDIAKLPLKYLENPQVYNVVTSALMKEQSAIDFKSAFKNVAGVSATVPLNGSTFMSMRGFYTGSYLRNGLASQQYIGLDPINIENIEVIKGPSGTLFGSSLITFGGLVNRVTKKPFDYSKTEIGIATGSWGLFRATADINTPLTKDKSVLLRMNAASTYQHSFQDYGFDRNFAIAPSLSYKVNDRFTVLLDAEYYKTKRVSPLYPLLTTGVKGTDFSQIWPAYNKSLTTDEPMIRQSSGNLFVQGLYRMSDKWKSTTQFAYRNAEWQSSATPWSYWLNDTVVRRAINLQRPRTMISYNVQQNFNGEFSVGSLRNRVVAGIDFYYVSTRSQAFGTLTYDTVNLNRPYTAISMSRFDNISALANPSSSLAEQYQYAGYLSDVVDLTSNLLAMVSLRVDRFDTKGTTTNGAAATGVYKQTSLSPKFGLVYQVWKDKVSVFANYMNGFQNVAPVTQPDGSTSTFKPQHGNQLEGGLKMDVWQHRISATLSYYNIEVGNSTRNEVRVVDGNSYTFTIQDGTQASKGFEAEIIANPFSGLNLIAGYGYNDNHYMKANASVEGKTATAAPRLIANWWASYTLQQGGWKGLGFGFGGNSRSHSWWDAVNTFKVPSLLTMDATAFYGTAKWKGALKLNNVGNKKGWDFNAVPQTPRQWIASMSLVF